MNQLIQSFETNNVDDFSMEIKEDEKIVYYPSSKAVQDGIEKSMA